MPEGEEQARAWNLLWYLDDGTLSALNDTIPSTNGEWDQCHVYTHHGQSDNNTSSNGTGVSQSACQNWVFDHSVFEATAATDVSTLLSCSTVKVV